MRGSGHPKCDKQGMRDTRAEAIMQICRQRLLLRLPKHPTIAGYFWFSYFLALGLLVFA